MKRIAVPTDNGQVCGHFGHAPQFSFFDADPESGEIRGEHHLEPPEHSPGVLPGWIAQQRANVVLAAGMGGRARELFAEQGIEVVVGVLAGDPRQAVEAYLKGTLSSGQNACSHDERRGCH